MNKGFGFQFPSSKGVDQLNLVEKCEYNSNQLEMMHIMSQTSTNYLPTIIMMHMHNVSNQHKLRSNCDYHQHLLSIVLFIYLFTFKFNCYKWKKALNSLCKRKGDR